MYVLRLNIEKSSIINRWAMYISLRVTFLSYRNRSRRVREVNLCHTKLQITHAFKCLESHVLTYKIHITFLF